MRRGHGGMNGAERAPLLRSHVAEQQRRGSLGAWHARSRSEGSHSTSNRSRREAITDAPATSCSLATVKSSASGVPLFADERALSAPRERGTTGEGKASLRTLDKKGYVDLDRERASTGTGRLAIGSVLPGLRVVGAFMG